MGWCGGAGNDAGGPCTGRDRKGSDMAQSDFDRENGSAKDVEPGVPGAPEAPELPDAPTAPDPEREPASPEITSSEPPPYAPDEANNGTIPSPGTPTGGARSRDRPQIWPGRCGSGCGRLARGVVRLSLGRQRRTHDRRRIDEREPRLIGLGKEMQMGRHSINHHPELGDRAGQSSASPASPSPAASDAPRPTPGSGARPFETAPAAAPDEPDAPSVPQTGGTGSYPGHALL